MVTIWLIFGKYMVDNCKYIVNIWLKYGKYMVDIYICIYISGKHMVMWLMYGKYMVK